MRYFSYLLVLFYACWGGDPSAPPDISELSITEEGTTPHCFSDSECDDQESCTIDHCDPYLGCVHENVVDGTPCDDGDKCTIGDSCGDGRCYMHKEIIQCPIIPCVSKGICDPILGCIIEIESDGTPCNDGSFCTLEAECKAGVCIPKALKSCDDGNPCSSDHCDPETGECLHDNISGIWCDDGNPCTISDHCEAGICVSSESEYCDDQNPCTEDYCETLVGCVNLPLENKPCNDKNPCTENDHCSAGTCVGGNEISCDDQNPCTDDFCDEKKGCLHIPKDGSCEDGDICTVGDKCLDGKCVSGNRKIGCCIQDFDCDDNDICTLEYCDLSNNLCIWEGEPDGDDGVGCAKRFGCISGYCEPSDGKCRPLHLDTPQILVSWNFQKDKDLAGFLWKKDVGSVTKEGLKVNALSNVTAFHLPEHFAPSGIKVLFIYASDCEGLIVRSDGKPIPISECVENKEIYIGVFVWLDNEVKKMDVDVELEGNITVKSIILFAWADLDCHPLTPSLLVEGGYITNLVLSGNQERQFIGFGDLSLASVYINDLSKPVSEPIILEDVGTELGIVADSGAILPDGRFIFAWESSLEPVIRLAMIESDGKMSVKGKLKVFDPSDAQHEPDISLSPNGNVYVVWTSDKVDGVNNGIAIVQLSIEQESITAKGPAIPLNSITAGNQRSPRISFGDTFGCAVWFSDTNGGEVILRGVSLKGFPDPDKKDLVIGKGETISNIDIVVSNNMVYSVWEVDPLHIGGVVVDKDFKLIKPIAFEPLLVGKMPIVVASASGAILFYIKGSKKDAQVFMAKINPEGVIEKQTPVTGKIDANTGWISGARVGHLGLFYAYLDTLSDPPGIYGGIISDKCWNGTLDCGIQAKPNVCVSFGNGYLEVDGAKWCGK